MIGFGNRDVSGSARTPLITGYVFVIQKYCSVTFESWAKWLNLMLSLSSNYILRGSLVSKAAWDSGSDDLWEKFWAECIKTGRLPVSLEKSLVSCATSCVNDLRTNSWQVTTSMLAITKIMKLKQIWFETNLKISDCWSLWLDHVRQRDRGVANQNICIEPIKIFVLIQSKYL